MAEFVHENQHAEDEQERKSAGTMSPEIKEPMYPSASLGGELARPPVDGPSSPPATGAAPVLDASIAIG